MIRFSDLLQEYQRTASLEDLVTLAKDEFADVCDPQILVKASGNIIPLQEVDAGWMEFILKVRSN